MTNDPVAGNRRFPAMTAAALATMAVGALMMLTATHEGTGPVETIPIEVAEARDVIGIDDAFVGLVTGGQVAVTHAYPDPGYGWKVPTICYGHTRGVTRGMKATLEQCRVWLIEDYREIVLPAIERCVKAPLTANEAAALADFVFNVGGAAACNSTLMKKLNAGDYAGAAEEFPKWVYSNGKVLPGLVKRRTAEQELFLTKESGQ